MLKRVTISDEEGTKKRSELADALVKRFNEEELARLAKRREEQTRFWSSTMMGAGEWEKQADAFADEGY